MISRQPHKKRISTSKQTLTHSTALLYRPCYMILLIMSKIEIEVYKIDNENLQKYITENIDSSQFDEIEKIKYTILALIQQSGKEDVEEMFNEILSDDSNFI